MFTWNPTPTEWAMGYDEIDRARKLILGLNPGYRAPVGAAGADTYNGLREAIRLVVTEGCRAVPIPTKGTDEYDKVLREALNCRNFEVLEYTNNFALCERATAEDEYCTKILMSIIAGRPKFSGSSNEAEIRANERAKVLAQISATINQLK